MSVEQMNTLLDDPMRVQSGGPPVAEEELQAVLGRLRRKPMPDDLIALYRRVNGAFIGRNLDVLPIDELEYKDTSSVFGEAVFHADLPTALIFAANNGGKVLFADVDGSLGHGIGAVYCDALANMDPDDMVYCAASVSELVDMTTRGIFPWED